jgi:hexulose-6-phosphate isomerase
LARQAGFDAVEVNLEPDLAYRIDSADAEIEALKALVAAQGLRISAVYSREQWRHPVTSADPATVQRGLGIIRRLAECACILEAEAVLVVPGAVDNSLFAPRAEIVSYELAYERAQAALATLGAELIARGSQAVLCVENVWNKFLLSPLEMRRFIDEIGLSSVGVYFDVGNVLLHGFPDQWIRILSQRIKRVHFKDFRSAVGTIHGFTGLLQGDIDWPQVIAALRTIGYRSYITAEVLPPYRYCSERLILECAAAMDAIIEEDTARAV